MIELKINDRVRVIDSQPERRYSINQTGKIISIHDLAGDDDVRIQLDKTWRIGSMDRINFSSTHARNQLEKITNETIIANSILE